MAVDGREGVVSGAGGNVDTMRNFGATEPPQIGEEEGSESQRGGNRRSQHAVIAPTATNTGPRTQRRGGPTVATLSREVAEHSERLDNLEANGAPAQPSQPAPIHPDLAYLAEVLHVEEQGLEAFERRDDVDRESSGRITFRPQRAEVEGQYCSPSQHTTTANNENTMILTLTAMILTVIQQSKA